MTKKIDDEWWYEKIIYGNMYSKFEICIEIQKENPSNSLSKINLSLEYFIPLPWFQDLREVLQIMKNSCSYI